MQQGVYDVKKIAVWVRVPGNNGHHKECNFTNSQMKKKYGHEDKAGAAVKIGARRITARP